MINKIILNKVACYKELTTLETDKKVNLIYGLNGTGKSTLSNYLYDFTNKEYNNCVIEELDIDEKILVYNKRFIKEYFHEVESLKGIFTLSRENKEAEIKIKESENRINELKEDEKDENRLLNRYEKSLADEKKELKNKVWEIKTKYSGGDRVLENCLSGLMGSKESMLNHLLSISKPKTKVTKTIEELKIELEAIKGDSAKKYGQLPILSFNAQVLETKGIFKKVIIGNENSDVADLIKRLNNSDWVKTGMNFLPNEEIEESVQCPFCQKKTITNELIMSIKNYFDETYLNSIDKLNSFFKQYESYIDRLPSKDSYIINPYIKNKEVEFEKYYNEVKRVLYENLNRISVKLKNPSKSISLISSNKSIKPFNAFIREINDLVDQNNKKIDKKDQFVEEIKREFWILMRFDYDYLISKHLKTKADNKKKILESTKNIESIREEIKNENGKIIEQQRNTVNIEEAIKNINNGLLELGIDGFSIAKYSDNLYQIVRTEESDNIFESLSEGEKMIISFLYFRELCKGKESATSKLKRKIIVIDDPISSLSHIFIFNIGQMIKNDFFRSPEFEQVFLLTHSLYFFYEMADTNHSRRKENQKLFRLIKNCEGSRIHEMKYNEIQNDYQSYWTVIKDDNQPPALIANCMRNIIEHFFGFIEKRDLNNIFQKKELQKSKYQAFYRYINRESHSISQNIFDFKEFNYEDFKEALGLVFKESGYKEHYDQMMK